MLRSAPESLQGQDSDVDLVVGDPSSNAVLREAGAQDAQAVLPMRVDDPKNAFVILAAQEMGGKARTVAAVNGAATLSRAKRAPPDVVISPQVLGGELIAMMVSGETVTPDCVMKHVFQRGNDTASAA